MYIYTYVCVCVCSDWERARVRWDIHVCRYICILTAQGAWARWGGIFF